ncbi:MAG: nodulation protein NfeD [bacterium]|nr:nodulation protein NfeD [bacterium]
MRLLKHSGVFRGFLTALFLLGVAGLGAANTVEVLKIEGAITPVTAKYIDEAIRLAEDNQAECLIIQMDTPGGLMEATWKIDKSILASLVPVIVYISPSGGRAASAGVYISYACHLIAMAPSTHLGSAHPVAMGGQDSSKTMMEKITNDAVAHIKGLAEKRGRNAEWAERAVRESVSITETEAVEKKVADIIAKDLGDLLDRLDGRTVKLDSGAERTLHTKDARVRHSAMDWRYRILDKISDPNIAYILMMLGIYGLFFELSNPGAILPGVIGGIFLILAFFALQVLSVNASGVLLILLALLFFFLEVKVNSHGLIALGGIVSMVLGSLMLFKTPVFRVSLSLILFAALLTAAFFLLALGAAYRTHRLKPVTGRRGMIGETGEALRTLDPEGPVAVHGEIWRAVSTRKVRKGETVEVTDVDGLTLKVKPR